MAHLNAPKLEGNKPALTERRLRVHAYRAEGKTLRQISEIEQVSQKTVLNDLRHKMDALVAGTLRHPKPASKPEVEQRRWDEYQMVLRGVSYRDVAAHFGLDTHTIWHDIETVIKQRIVPALEQTRAMELDKLDRAEFALSDRVERGDPRAIEIYLRILERRARYLPVEVPVKIQADVTQTPPLPEVLRTRLEAARVQVESREAVLRERPALQLVEGSGG